MSPVNLNLIHVQFKVISKHHGIIVYVGVKESVYNGKKYLWPRRTYPRAGNDIKLSVEAEEGEVIAIKYYGKKWSAILFARVKEGARYEDNDVVIEGVEGVERVDVDANWFEEMKCQVLRDGYAIAKDWDKALLNIIAWKLAKLQQPQREQELPEQPYQVANVNAVALEDELTPAPAQAAPAVEAPAPTTPAKAELVPVVIVLRHLPHKDSVKYTVRTEVNGSEVVERKRWEGARAKLAIQLDSIRKVVHRKLQQYAVYVDEMGLWVTTPSLVEKVKEVEKYVREKLEGMRRLIEEAGYEYDDFVRRYTVRATTIYVEPEDARMVLELAVRKLCEAADELEEEIRKANERRMERRVRELLAKKATIEGLRRAIEEYMRGLGL